MIGDGLMKALLGVYLVICLVYLYERQWAKALYFLGAAILTFSILWGMGK